MISSYKVSIVVSCLEKLTYSQEKWECMLQAILEQQYISISQVIILSVHSSHNTSPNIVTEKLYYGDDKSLCVSLQKISCNKLGIGWNIVTTKIANENVIWIQAERSPIFLQKSTCFIMNLALERDSGVGLVYGDYTLVNNADEVQEKFLLEYHSGRLRDGTDLGYVFGLKNSTLRQISIPNHLEYSTVYDLRLRFASISELRHIGNRFSGSLYRIEKTSQTHNVFDYLQDDKKKQLEMEAVLTEHLQRIGAYLAPGAHYQKIPDNIHTSPILISIIIPVYRRPEFISTAIESALCQTLGRAVEVIVVVNGGAEDPTNDVVRRFLRDGEYYQENAPEVRLFTTDINNIGLCLNIGIMEARGKYYLQLDSDDRLKPYAAQQVFEMFVKNPDAGMVIGSYEVWEKKKDGTLFRREDIPTVKHEEWTENNGRNNLLRINGAGAPRAYLIDLVKQLGWFSVNDEPHSKNYGEDYDMVLKMSEKYRITRIWEPIYEVVRHVGSTDHSIDQMTIDRNENAKDMMRYNAIERRKRANIPLYNVQW